MQSKAKYVDCAVNNLFELTLKPAVRSMERVNSSNRILLVKHVLSDWDGLFRAVLGLAHR